MVYVRHLCGTLSEHTGLYELLPNRAPNLETANFTIWPHNQSWLHPSLFFPLTNSDVKGPPAGGLTFKTTISWLRYRDPFAKFSDCLHVHSICYFWTTATCEAHLVALLERLLPSNQKASVHTSLIFQFFPINGKSSPQHQNPLGCRHALIVFESRTKPKYDSILHGVRQLFSSFNIRTNLYCSFSVLLLVCFLVGAHISQSSK